MNLTNKVWASGRRTGWSYSVIFLACAALATQQSPPSSRETISVNYVLVPFVAQDGKGRALQNLRQRDVFLLVDGVPAAYDMFAEANNAPVSFTILLDTSGSMDLAGKMAGAKTAINALLATRRPKDDFSLWTFADGEVQEAVPFTERSGEIMSAVMRVEPFGKTAFHDALALMPDKTILGRNGSRAIILLTDGLDNASIITRPELTKILEAVDVPIYPLALRPRAALTGAPASPEHFTDLELLEELATISGGRALVTSNLNELEHGIREIQKDLRSQYLLGFKPTGRGGVRFRKIALKVPGRNRVVRVRAGYHGTAPPVLSAGRTSRTNTSG